MQCQRISLVVQKANTLPAQGGSRFSGGGGGGGGGERRMMMGPTLCVETFAIVLPTLAIRCLNIL